MIKLTASQREEAERSLDKAFKELGKVDKKVIGAYLLKQVGIDQAINELKKDIAISKNDFYKTKATLLQYEYLALILIKNP